MVELSSNNSCVEHLSEFEVYVKDGTDGFCYISDKTDWDVVVYSNNEDGCDFIKVDKCIYDDSSDSHCDCAFMTPNELHFVEIKQSVAFDAAGTHKKRSKIRSDARNQLANTINMFKSDFGLRDLSRVYGVIASKPAIAVQTIRPIMTRNQTAIAVFAAKCGCTNIYEGNYIQIN